MTKEKCSPISEELKKMNATLEKLVNEYIKRHA